MQKYIAGRMEEESDQLYQRPKVMGKTWDIEKKNKEIVLERSGFVEKSVL